MEPAVMVADGVQADGVEDAAAEYIALDIA
jgi:hypothetical protein